MSKPNEKNTSRVIPSDKGSDYPQIDLSGQTRQRDQLRMRLDSLNKDLESVMKYAVRALFAIPTARVSISHWSQEKPEGLTFWQCSTRGSGEGGQHPVLGLDRQSLSCFSELFFQGDPNAISDDDIACVRITGTDDRQIGRLYYLMCHEIGTNLGFDCTNWASYWMESEPEHDLLWACLDISDNDWSFKLYFAWPMAMSYRNEKSRFQPIDGASLAPEMAKVPIRLGVEIAAAQAFLSDVESLRVGDVIDLDMGNTATARAGDVDILKGHVCDSSGQLCLRISNNLGME